MSPTETALIAEAEEKSLRKDILDITLYEFNGERTPNSNWWQVYDVWSRCSRGWNERRKYEVTR